MAMAEWISAIPFEDWSQQHRLADGQIRPSMMTDLSWHGFGDACSPVVRAIRQKCFPNCDVYQRMLSVVMPGHVIEPHRDHQAPYWLCRVHVPLTTNEQSEFIVDGQSHRMDVGMAYRVNTLAEHSVVNAGAAPRIHFMFDVRGG